MTFSFNLGLCSSMSSASTFMSVCMFTNPATSDHFHNFWKLFYYAECAEWRSYLALILTDVLSLWLLETAILVSHYLQFHTNQIWGRCLRSLQPMGSSATAATSSTGSDMWTWAAPTPRLSPVPTRTKASNTDSASRQRAVSNETTCTLLSVPSNSC